VVVIQKIRGAEEVDRWTGARSGKHQEFETYAGRAALAMGQHFAQKLVFLADGAHTNWELQKHAMGSHAPERTGPSGRAGDATKG